MKLDRYLRASSLEECIGYLTEWGGEAALLAGGTDLIPRISQGRLSVSTVIDITRIPELSQIGRKDGGLMLGAMLRLSAVQKEGLLSGPAEVLRRCSGHVSSMQVRNAATLGGNVCNASPAADTVPGLLALDAVALIRGKQGFREAPLEAFFTGPGRTALGAGELLTGLFIPSQPAHTGTAYRKYAIRGDSDISIVGAGARVTLGADGKIASARIALASVGATPLRLKREEQMLAGMRPEEAPLEDIAAACAESCSPITDQRATKEYRKEMVRVWVADALKGAAAAAGD
ncbi:MAG: xanthine dehydrogenase family protein subunit M [Clostridiales bacterium]|nr:xanthine dehydrogenase family protein subunit M [Clostridiales bacterium]